MTSLVICMKPYLLWMGLFRTLIPELNQLSRFVPMWLVVEGVVEPCTCLMLRREHTLQGRLSLGDMDAEISPSLLTCRPSPRYLLAHTPQSCCP